MASSTSQGSLPEVQEVGPTGPSEPQSPSRFWDSMLKRRSSSPDSDGAQQHNQSPRESEVGKQGGGGGAPNVLSWLAGLSPKSARRSQEPPPETAQRTAVAVQTPSVLPTGGSSQGGSAQSKANVAPAQGWSDANARDKPRARRPSASGGTYVSTANLPDVSVTPQTATLVAQHHSRQHQEVKQGVETREAEGESHDTPTASAAGARSGAEAGDAAIERVPSPSTGVDVRPRRSSSPTCVAEEAVSAEHPSICCTECGACITGAVFMLHDQPYCCQRHRLAAYHKMEKEGQRGLTPAQGSTHSLSTSTGLRASYASWL